MTQSGSLPSTELDALESTTKPSKPASWEQTTVPPREATRRWIAIWLLVGYLGLIVGILAYVWQQGVVFADSKDLLTLLITTYTTLLGSALGYYFGRQDG
jgi:polyferredoxin